MHVLQDGRLNAFPRHLVPAVTEIVRTRFREVVHGVSFDPHDNVMIGTSEGLIFGGAKELEMAFPEPVSILDTWMLVDEFEDDPWADLELPSVRQVRWDELRMLTRRPHYRSWKSRRDTKYHVVNGGGSRWDRWM